MRAIKPHNKGGPRLNIEWHMARYCNLDCSYCSTYQHDQTSPSIPLEKLKIAATHLLSYSQELGSPFHLELTGGEPTQHPDFIEFLRFLSESGFRSISFTTNGTAPQNLYEEALQYSQSITISLHQEYKLVAKIRKLAKTLQSVGDQYSEKRRIKVHFMVLPGTIDQCIDEATRLADYGVRTVLRRIRPVESVETGEVVKPFQHIESQPIKNYQDAEWTGKYYSQEEEGRLLEFDATNFNNTVVYDENGKESYVNVNEISKNFKNKFKGWFCSAGRESLRVDYTGDVRLCSGTGSVFNIFDKDISEKVQKSHIVCPAAVCVSATNINISKAKSLHDFESLIRLGQIKEGL